LLIITNSIRVFTFFIRLIIKLHFILAVWVAFTSFYFIKYDPPLHSLMIYRAFISRFDNQQKKNIKLADLPWYIEYMLIRLEDCNFRKHNGIDIEAMKHAMEMNKTVGSGSYGGSTITQQLARTLYLFPDKLYVRKYLEIVIALEMEIFIPKDRILELYLNNVEWGKGIYGIESASWFYYNKSSIYLSRDQAARLLTILASPIRYSPRTFYTRRLLNIRYNFLSNLLSR